MRGLLLLIVLGIVEGCSCTASNIRGDTSTDGVHDSGDVLGDSDTMPDSIHDGDLEPDGPPGLMW